MNESFPGGNITGYTDSNVWGVLSNPEMQESLLLPGPLMQRNCSLVTRACMGQFLTGSVPIVVLSQRNKGAWESGQDGKYPFGVL